MSRIILLLSIFIIINLEIKEINFLTYHQRFIEVEELISEEKFNSAAVKLEKLLAEYKPKFTKDYVIISQLCLLNDDKSKAIYWIEESMKLGAKLNCLQEIELLNNNLTKNDWENLRVNTNKLDSIYRSRINHSLGILINRNYQDEQHSKGKKNYKSIVYANFNKLTKLIKRDAFPSEGLLGIDDSRYAVKISECEFDNSKVTVTLLHYDHPISELTEEVMVTAIKKGQLHPREFASIFTFEKNRISRLYRDSNKIRISLSDYNFMFPFEKRKNNINRVNEDRYKFGICSIETDKKKVMIQNKYKMKLFFGYK